MTARKQLIREIEQVSDALVEEVLDFLLFVKGRQSENTSSSVEEQTLKPSVLDRMGGMPQHLLSVGNLSDRDVRRVAMHHASVKPTTIQLDIAEIATLNKDFDIYRRYRNQLFERVFYP
jgi:hypothetical protein